MKRLWKIVPPCLSDILGFQDVMHHTDGLGVIDDSSPYKPLHFDRSGEADGRSGRPEGERRSGHSEGERRSGRPEGERRHGDRGGAGRSIPMERQEMRHGGRPEGRHGGRGRGGRMFDVRVVASEIQEVDVVNGTEEKVMQAFERGNERFQPKFALLTCAPCAAMINTDLEEVARQVQEKYSIPAGAVALDGQKDYLYGVSCTLEAIGKLLLEETQTIPNTVNLLGCNAIDWPEAAVQEAERWLTDAGFRVLSRWGAQETAERLKGAAAASVNLVVNVSGLRLARYMERELQIPYVVGAPFGEGQCVSLLEQLKHGGAAKEEGAQESPEALIVGEQLQAQAIRAALLERGWRSVRVCSFFDMDKQLMQPGDQKLLSEDDLKAQLECDTLKAVFGDSDYRLVTDRTLPWVPLPNPGDHGPAEYLPPFSMVGAALESWLDAQLANLEHGN